jgi:hypothetical protein
MYYYFFLLSYTILGAGIKYIDAAYDDKTFNKKLALIIAPLLGGLWAYTMLINPVSATILLAIICGVFFKGKIDNLAHLAGLLVIIAIIVILGVQFLIIPLIFLAAAALLDEVGNDTMDKYKDRLNKKSFWHKFAMKFFDHRWAMKIAILATAIMGIIPIFFFIAIVLFDYAYLTVRNYSQFKQGTSDTSWLHLKMFKISEFISSRRIAKENIIKDQYNI